MQSKIYTAVDDPSEQLLFCTIQIVAEYPDGGRGFGTGFLYAFSQSPDGLHVPAIVTNRHVVQGAQGVLVRLRECEKGGDKPVIGRGVLVRLHGIDSLVVAHEESDTDLCAIPIAHVLHQLYSSGCHVWAAMITRNMLPQASDNPSLAAIEDVLMVGYPSGLWDEVNNMPIARRGITATHPTLDWNGKKQFLIDAACFPGSSGSPVFAVQEKVVFDREESTTKMLVRYRLLGILYAGPQHRATGEIQVVDIPTVATPIPSLNIPMNLGIVIKSETLEYFEGFFERQRMQGDHSSFARSLLGPLEPIMRTLL